MARKPVFDDCMLCEKCPCECRRPAKKVAAKRAPKKAASPVQAVEEVSEDVAPVAPVTPTPAVTPPRPKADPRAAMRAAAGRARPVTPREQVPVQPPKAREESRGTGDPVIDQAIGHLAQLLHPEERRKWQWLMWSNGPVSERAARWKNRRREVVAGETR